MENKHFCIDCKQIIPVKAKFPFGKELQGYEFEEGWRCEGCGKAKVKKIREGK